MRQILSPELFQAAQPHFMRSSAMLIPEVVFWLMATVSLTQRSMAGSVSAFWADFRGTMPFLPPTPITEEAFCTARKKLRLRFFKNIFRSVIQRYQNSTSAERYRWKGFRLLGIDGMKMALPQKLKKYFQPASNQKGDGKAAQGLLVGLVGLWDGICYGFKLVSGKDDEWYIVLHLPRKLESQFPDFPAEFTARIIRYQRKGFRLSFLITSLLDTKTYSYEAIVNLYHERWRQETMHREWKYSLSMSNLRSTTVRGIFKEVYVQLTINNVLRWLMSDAAQLSDCRPVDLKFLECKRLLMSYVCVMSTSPLELLPTIYRELIHNLSEQKILVRPGRSYRREYDDKVRYKGKGQYVLPAKILEEERAVA